MLMLPIVVAALTSSLTPPTPPPAAAADVIHLTDHHVHIIGPGLMTDWQSLGVTFSRDPELYQRFDHLLEASTSGPTVDQILLLPMGYLYGNAEFRGALSIDAATEADKVRAENDFAAAEAERLGAGAIAFCAVNPLRPYAMDEVKRCRTTHRSPGIKLHLANAQVHFRDADHLNTLAALFGWAEAAKMTVLVHVDPQQSGLDVDDIRRFIDVVLAPHPDLDVCIAHLGGSGGHGPWAQSVVRAFATWLETERAAGRTRSGIYFDVSAAVLARPSDGVPSTSDGEFIQFADGLRRLGLERIVFASDYPVFDPRPFAELLRTRTGLTADEFKVITGNQLPVMRTATTDQARPEDAGQQEHGHELPGGTASDKQS